jgi:MFS family permease
VHQLNGSDFTWVASAYALSASMFIPLSGNLAQIFGRRPIVLGGIVTFAVGSAVCGSARTLIVLIVGRGESYEHSNNSDSQSKRFGAIHSVIQ